MYAVEKKVSKGSLGNVYLFARRNHRWLERGAFESKLHCNAEDRFFLSFESPFDRGHDEKVLTTPWLVDCPSIVKITSLLFFFVLGDRLLDIPCKVCSDRSSGKHYGIYSCDGKYMLRPYQTDYILGWPLTPWRHFVTSLYFDFNLRLWLHDGLAQNGSKVTRIFHPELGRGVDKCTGYKA